MPTTILLPTRWFTDNTMIATIKREFIAQPTTQRTVVNPVGDARAKMRHTVQTKLKQIWLITYLPIGTEIAAATFMPLFLR